MSDSETQTPELYRAVLGPRNAAYYLPYFRRAEERGYPPVSWNWPVFFFGFFWFLYRKLYVWAAIVFCFPTAAVIASGLVETLIPGMGQAVLLTLVFGFLLLYLPMNANAIYYRWARRELEAGRTELPGQHDAQVERLAQRGGCNANLAFVIFGAFMMLTVMLGSFAPA